MLVLFGTHGWKEAKVRLALRWSVTKAVLSYAMKREKEEDKHERQLYILTALKNEHVEDLIAVSRISML